MVETCCTHKFFLVCCLQHFFKWLLPYDQKRLIRMKAGEHNKQIMALAVARWDANTFAASPLSRTCLRPIFGRYVPRNLEYEEVSNNIAIFSSRLLSIFW